MAAAEITPFDGGLRDFFSSLTGAAKFATLLIRGRTHLQSPSEIGCTFRAHGKEVR
jgi:hypothetical protein